MKLLPQPVSAFIKDRGLADVDPAYVFLDRMGAIHFGGGHVEKYGLTGISPGQEITQVFLPLEGMFPFSDDQLDLPRVATSSGCFANIYLFNQGEFLWLLVLDASEEVTFLQEKSQSRNESRLQIHGSKQGKEHWPHPSLFFANMEVGVFLKETGRLFRVMGVVPAWMRTHFDRTFLPGDLIELHTAMPFLETIPTDFEAFQVLHPNQAYRSSIWTETNPEGIDIHFRAHVLNINGQVVYLVAQVQAEYEELQLILQRAREKVLNSEFIAQTQEILKMSIARFAMAANQLPAVFWTADETLKLTSVFGRMRRFFGLNDQDLEGQSLDMVFAQSDQLDHLRALHIAAFGGQAGCLVLTHGGRKWEVFLEPLRQVGQHKRCAIGMAFDISERDEKECQAPQGPGTETISAQTPDHTPEKELLDTLHQLQKVNDLVDVAHMAGMAELAANVSHSLGNNLNSTLVSTQSIASQTDAALEWLRFLGRVIQLVNERRDDLASFFSEHPQGKNLANALTKIHASQQKAWQRVKDECHQIIGSIQSMDFQLKKQYEFAKGHLIVEEPTDLNLLTQHAMTTKAAFITKEKIEVKTEFAQIPLVLVDRAKVTLTLFCLIKNAVEAITAAHDHRQREIRLTTEQQEDQVIITVADTGIGIPSWEIKNVFGYGYTTKPGREGFGLHYCANAVKEMNGRIQVDSPGPGKGAEVRIFFPKAPDGPAAPRVT